MDISKKVAVQLGKQRRSHPKVTKTQLAQPWDSEIIIKPGPSFDGGHGGSNASSSNLKGSTMKRESINSIEKPLFVVADWVTWFLPTLYHVLFCSEKPFHEFSKGSAFAATVQDVLDIVHPGNTYIVTIKSKIYTTVWYPFLCLIHSLITPLKHRHMDRIVEKRSDFGTHTLHLVEILLKQFKDNSCAVAKYAKWATREDGPALWRVPSAEGSSPGNNDYMVLV